MFPINNGSHLYTVLSPYKSKYYEVLIQVLPDPTHCLTWEFLTSIMIPHCIKSVPVQMQYKPLFFYFVNSSFS